MDPQERETHRTELGASSEAATEGSSPTSFDHGGTRTRTSTVWTAVFALVASLVLVIIFILQNLQDVSVSFLVFHGQIPLGVALLVAATLGGVIVLAAGAARIVQLRRTRRGKEHRPDSR